MTLDEMSQGLRRIEAGEPFGSVFGIELPSGGSLDINDLPPCTPRGIPTASEFDKIITAGGQASKQAGAYADRLLAEIMVGKPVDTFKGTAWTERGNELEPDAAAFYELQRDVEAVPVGFCTDDDRSMGASPDRLIGEDGLLEIKCPAPHTHVKTLLDQTLDRDHYPQVQGRIRL